MGRGPAPNEKKKKKTASPIDFPAEKAVMYHHALQTLGRILLPERPPADVFVLGQKSLRPGRISTELAARIQAQTGLRAAPLRTISSPTPFTGS